MPPTNTDGPEPVTRGRPNALQSAITTTSIARTPIAEGPRLAASRRTGDPARELAAWRMAVEHPHSLGLPAAVPELAARHLRRRGIIADWTTAA